MERYRRPTNLNETYINPPAELVVERSAVIKGNIFGLNTPSIFGGNEITKDFYVVVTVAGSQRTLNAGRDYTVTYQNNKNAGKATLVLTGINGYSGTLLESKKF